MTRFCKNYVIYFLVIFHKSAFHTSASLLQAVNQPVLCHSFVLAHKISTAHIYFGNHRDDIGKRGKSVFLYSHFFMPGDLASNIRQLISYLTQISGALDVASLNPYLSLKYV